MHLRYIAAARPKNDRTVVGSELKTGSTDRQGLQVPHSQLVLVVYNLSISP